MKKMFFLCAVILCAIASHAQYTIQLIVKNQGDRNPIAGASATISSLAKTTITDTLGRAIFSNLSEGSYRITISHVGFETQGVDITVPQTETVKEVWLEEAEEEEEEVIVTATRMSRSISDIPTRVETISGEEISEKANMKPGDIRMMLNESTGIQTQQTSATSYNSSIRIQGLDGRYTQLLRDGFPLYSGFAGGLSLMQVAPLDLKQVEVIKGSSSTLYGGGAIAGLVNLVSKTPREERELSFLANATSAKGLDLSAFYAEKYGSAGLTVFASRNTAAPYDPAHIGLTAIPKFDRYTINPKLFFYGKKVNGYVGGSYVTENRLGGSMSYIKEGTAGYFEKNQTQRTTGLADFHYRLSEASDLQFKTSYTLFGRTITVPSYLFEGFQQSSYSELNFNLKRETIFWIAGLNLLTDDFKEQPHYSTELRNYHHNTVGLFVQNTWSPTPKFSLESGLRADYVKSYGFELLPRVSAMFKPTSKFTIRVGGGLGYKTPTVFNEEAEKVQFQNILPVNPALARNERSTGANLDFNYRTRIGEMGFTANQLFFYTRLNQPLVLSFDGASSYEFLNADGHIDTRGLETNLRLNYHNFKLFIGYTYADVNSHYNEFKSWFPLTARHRLNNVLMYEKEGKWKVGLEAYYFSRQKLSDLSMGKSYWLTGFLVERSWKAVSVFANFENLFDARQTRFDTIYTGSIENPVFRDIYAPVDGFVVNGGIKVRL